MWGGPATLTPALSHRMGEGESCSAGRPIQALWKLRETGLAVPYPAGRERVRVRVVLSEIRLLLHRFPWDSDQLQIRERVDEELHGDSRQHKAHEAARE